LYLDIDDEIALEADSVGLFMGQEFTRIQLTGTINGTNATFALPSPYYPIYPKNSRSILPLTKDVVVETLKGTTYTVVAVTSVDLITDPDTLDQVYGAVTLTTPPTSEGADSVHMTAVEEFEPFIVGNVEPEDEQDVTEIPRIFSKNKITSYGAITSKIKADLTISQNSLQVLQKFGWRPMVSGDDGYSDLPVGYSGLVRRTQPENLYAYLAIVVDGVIIGRVYYQNVKVPAKLPTVKAGEQLTLSIEMSAGEAVWIVKDPT